MLQELRRQQNMTQEQLAEKVVHLKITFPALEMTQATSDYQHFIRLLGKDLADT